MPLDQQELNAQTSPAEQNASDSRLDSDVSFYVAMWFLAVGAVLLGVAILFLIAFGIAAWCGSPMWMQFCLSGGRLACLFGAICLLGSALN